MKYIYESIQCSYCSTSLSNYQNNVSRCQFGTWGVRGTQQAWTTRHHGEASASCTGNFVEVCDNVDFEDSSIGVQIVYNNVRCEAKAEAEDISSFGLEVAEVLLSSETKQKEAATTQRPSPLRSRRFFVMTLNKFWRLFQTARISFNESKIRRKEDIEVGSPGGEEFLAVISVQGRVFPRRPLTHSEECGTWIVPLSTFEPLHNLHLRISNIVSEWVVLYFSSETVETWDRGWWKVERRLAQMINSLFCECNYLSVIEKNCGIPKLSVDNLKGSKST